MKRYVDILSAQRASDSLKMMDALTKDKAVKLAELVAIVEAVTGRQQPKRKKADHAEELRRYFTGQRNMDQKDDAFGRQQR